MAERSGIGFPISKRKTLASKQASLERKDNTSTYGDGPVQIDSSDSESEGFVNGGMGTSVKGGGKASNEAMKSGKTGKETLFENPATNGDWGKGGKAYASGKATGKGGLPHASVVKPPVTEVELKLDMNIPEGARVLMDCEAATMLQGIQESLTVLSDDPDIKMPVAFNKALDYCNSKNNYTNSDSARQVLDTLKEHGVTDGEICMIANVCPETIDEVYALIPSLKANKHKNEGPIREALVNVANFVHS